jgi:hypothetical protein
MNRKSRILTWVFVAAVAYTAVAKLVYPRWIRPFFTYDERIVKEKERLEVLEEMEDRVKTARFAYRAYCERNGSVDPDTVRNELKTTLDALIERHGLKEATAVPPRRMVEDRKTGLQTMQFHLSAEGPLKDVVAFLKDVEELPQVARLRSPRIAPASSSSRNKDEDRFALRATLEAAVLPKMKVVGMLTDSQLRQPPAHVRHQDRPYAMVWEREPFFEYKPPAPPPPPPPVRVVEKSPPRPVKPVDHRWKDRAQLQVVMALLTLVGEEQRGEVMLCDARSRDERYVSVGEDFDGGKLLFVHQRGVLVGREDGVFVYPLGERLNNPIQVAQAAEFPELQAAAGRLNWQPPLAATPPTEEPVPTDGSSEPSTPEVGTNGEAPGATAEADGDAPATLPGAQPTVEEESTGNKKPVRERLPRSTRTRRVRRP